MPYFTARGRWTDVIANPDGGDPIRVGLNGSGYLVPTIEDGDTLQIDFTTGVTESVLMEPIPFHLIDGEMRQVRDAPDDPLPDFVRAPANSDEYGLELGLHYRVEWISLRIGETTKKASVRGWVFAAPDSDVPFYVPGSAPVPGSTGVGITRGDGIHIDGSVETYAELPADVEAGASYVVLSSGLLYVKGEDWPPVDEGISILGPQGVPGDASLDELRVGVFQFEHPNSNTDVGTFNVSTRRAFEVTQEIPDGARWRVHYRNRNHLANTNGGTMTGFAMAVGEAVVDTTGVGDLTGATVSAPVQIQTPTTLTSGVELITPWVEKSTYDPVPYKEHFITYPVNVAAGQTLSIGGGRHWFTATPGDYLVANPSGMAKVDNQAIGEMYIEFEFANDSAPTMLIVAPSVANGGNTGAVANRAELGGVGHLWELENQGVAPSIAVGGAWSADYLAASPKWDYYDTLSQPLNVDAVLLLALCSSDVCAGTAVATVKGNVAINIAKARLDYPGARIILTTLPPRGDSTGTPEANRLEINTWLSGCPAGADQCIEINGPLTDWASPQRLRAQFAGAPPSADIVHWSEAGHSTVARLIPVRALATSTDTNFAYIEGGAP